jgi:hypothetical protein
MKKFFTLIFALMGFAGVANAASEDDLAPLKHSYVFVCDDYTNDGTGSRTKGGLFGDDHFLDVTGGSVATNKGQVDLSVLNEADDNHVTQYIVDKYGADYAGAHYNSLRLKNNQDVIAMKLTAGSKIIMFVQGNNKTGKEARIPCIARTRDDINNKKGLNDAPDENHPTTDSGFRWEYTVDDDGLYYVGSYNGDMFVSFIIIEANEAEGTPLVKVGNQTFADGLWFKEVTVKPALAYGMETEVYYTTDGSEPTAESAKYTEPIKCYAPATLKFQAFVAGAPVPDADNEAAISFLFDAPSIEAEGANVTISSPYEGATNFYALNDEEAVEGSSVTLTESATVSAYSQIVNGTYATFTTKKTSKDVYVLNPIKEKKTIAVVSADVVVDDEATASSTDGSTVYKVENGVISADKADFFVKNLTWKVLKDATAQYQVPEGQEAYIQMSNTNITFSVDAGDKVNVKVICSKNSCKNLDADDAEDGSPVNDRKCFVTVSGTNYGGEDLKLNPDGNVIEFELEGAEGGSIFTFQKYSGTGNILISSIEITPANANVLLGDANKDGVIDVADVVAIVNYILEQPAENFDAVAADANEDQTIDVSDVVAVVNIILGQGGGADAARVKAVLLANGFIF